MPGGIGCQVIEEPHNEGKINVMVGGMARAIDIVLKAIVENLKSNWQYLWGREGLGNEGVQFSEASKTLAALEHVQVGIMLQARLVHLNFSDLRKLHYRKQSH